MPERWITPGAEPLYLIRWSDASEPERNAALSPARGRARAPHCFRAWWKEDAATRGTLLRICEALAELPSQGKTGISSRWMKERVERAIAQGRLILVPLQAAKTEAQPSASAGYEHLSYNGESAQNRKAFERYLEDAQRGKTTLQLQGVASQLTPDLRRFWAAQSFTGVTTPAGDFDAIICNVSYHFHTHGQKYGSIRAYTEAAKRYFAEHGRGVLPDAHGLIKLPKGIFDREGRIITFFG